MQVGDGPRDEASQGDEVSPLLVELVQPGVVAALGQDEIKVSQIEKSDKSLLKGGEVLVALQELVHAGPCSRVQISIRLLLGIGLFTSGRVKLGHLHDRVLEPQLGNGLLISLLRLRLSWRVQA